MLGKVVARFTRATPEEMGWATEALAMAVEEPKKIRGRKGDKRLVDIKSKAAVKESKTKVAAATKTSSAPRKESGKGDDVGQAEGFNPTPVQPSGKQQK
jgi:hypothetical protein